MHLPHRFLTAFFMTLASWLFAAGAKAELQVKAEVISSTTTSSSVRFTFSGDFTSLAAPVNLTGFVFTGVLESSPDLITPFAPVPGATSPYLVPLDAPDRMFYRSSQ